ncbi:MAG: NAD-binding protein [Desulfobacterales bacterium]|nr:NAD-binding protein [Desulfobacterales bacterium]
MENIWIIGAGKVGLKAAKVLGPKHGETDIILVEKDKDRCKQLKSLSFKIVCMDGVKYLVENLKEPLCPGWIIPAIPVHVAYEWLKIKLSEKFIFEPIPVPDQLETILPNPIKGDVGQFYISNADFICPENCPEPDEICTYTGKPRPRILHQFLQSIKYENFRSFVITSRQLAPGLGGYPPHTLFKALAEIQDSTAPVLLSTACRCHGVMHAFKISKKILLEKNKKLF